MVAFCRQERAMITDAEPTLTLSEIRQLAGSANTFHEGSTGVTIEQKTESARFRFPKPLVIVPMLPDGSPDWEHRSIGVPMDVAHDGELQLYWGSTTELPTTALIALLQEPDGKHLAAGIDIESVRNLEGGAVKVIGRVGGFGEEILRTDNLSPSFNPETLSLQLGYAEDVLAKWAAIGAFESVFIDRVQVCPLCESLPTFRLGCPNCGSAQIENDHLIHHFACAHVGRVCDFECEDDLVCPKCRKRHLVVGADFDYVTGPYRCQNCEWTNLQAERVAQCLRCKYRFPAHQAETRELRGYRVHRLDPLAYLPAC
jgi:hypothetical protein